MPEGALAQLSTPGPLDAANQFVEKKEKQDCRGDGERKHIKNHGEKPQSIALLPVHRIDTKPIELPNVIHPPCEKDQNGNRENYQSDADFP